MNILKLLKPNNIFVPKKRLGPPEDGGYVMPENVLQDCSAILTYGVGNDTRYEEDFVRSYQKPAYLFDHTVSNFEWERDGLKFKPHGLGYQENCKEWYEDYQELGITGDIFLKIDVEGYEYEYFKNTDITKMNDHVMGMILEIHWIDNIENRENAIKLLEKLDPGFLLCHIHGNSWGDLWDFEGYSIPKVLELSFINRKYVSQYEPDTQDYPIDGLDISNCPHREDYKLDFLKSV
jgi:hypothetical protein